MVNAKTPITVIGGGLAGTEAAWQLAEQGLKVKLYEMRPIRKTPAHHTGNLAELVCSNSLGSEFLTTARGLLIKEMQVFNSLIINSAIKAKVPAGQALAVDRDLFAQEVTKAITSHPNIELLREEYTELPKDGITVIATGPLTSETFAQKIQSLLHEALPGEQANFLNFFDAASPILTLDSIDMDIAFRASRYGKGGTDDYINCPFYEQEEFDNFYQALISAERVPQKDFEKGKFFESCLPIEVIADRGQNTLTFGPLKPVGLRDPRYPDRRPVAVVQLRQDNVIGSLYNIVGFQTNLKWREQKRVFSMIPGLQNLEIVRYGVMHQNIYINSPKLLNADMSLRSHPNIYFAGQITGVEGYTESAATGIIVARSIASQVPKPYLPRETMMGALAHYIANADAQNFQPMNSNWGIVNVNTEGLDKKILKNKDLKHKFLADRALDLITQTTVSSANFAKL